MVDSGVASTTPHSDPEFNELVRVLRLTRHGMSIRNPITYRPDDDWNAWLDEFQTGSGPHLANVWAAAGKMQFGRIAEFNRRHEERIDASVRASGRVAALDAIDALKSARHVRQIERLRAVLANAAGDLEAQFATVFAVHAATLNLPLHATLVGYLYIEWRAGTTSNERSRSSLTEEVFAAENLTIATVVREVLKLQFKEFSNAACA